jgi:hypothetical protein
MPSSVHALEFCSSLVTTTRIFESREGELTLMRLGKTFAP